MLAFVAVCLLAGMLSSVAINCPRFKPDGSAPLCTECVDCNVPSNATVTSLYGDEKDKTGSTYNNPVNAGDPYIVKMTQHKGGGTDIRIDISGSASDVYRVVGFYDSAVNTKLYYWLTGNNKGNGVTCQATANPDRKDLGMPMIYDWDPVPANVCF